MRKCLIVILLSATRMVLLAQVPAESAVRDSIDNYADSHPNEKIYIHFDRPSYNAGDTIWFKAYIVTGQGSATFSKNFYVDVTDTGGTILQHSVYPVQLSSSAAGTFSIPALYAQQSVHIHAYTRWMLNFDSAFMYDKDIRITYTQATQAKGKVVAPHPAPVAAIRFLPEGGDYINGIRAKVAFKAVYNNGLPASVKGAVVSSKGETVDSFGTVHDGMGFFYIEPQPGEIYKAIWQDEQQHSYTTQLPIAKPAGATLQVAQVKGTIAILVTRTDDAAPALKQMHLVGTMQQQVAYSAPVNLEASNFSGGSISINSLPPGIIQLTLFDANWQPVAERIAFVHKDDYLLNAGLRFDTIGLAKRKKNVMVINMPDSIEANLSIAVTDAGVGVDSTDNIITRMLLTGELKGSVYHPYYYFSNKSDSLVQQLDLVMLTNGWRRYKWNDIITGKTPALQYQPDTAYLTLAGKVYDLKPEKIAQAGDLLIAAKGTSLKDTARDYFMVPLNKDGSFVQPNYSFNDTLKIFYQFASKKGAGFNLRAEVNFTSGALPAPKRVDWNKHNPAFTGTDTTGDFYNRYLAMEQAKLDSLLKLITLKNVIVKARAKSRLDSLDSKYTTGPFSNANSIRLDLTTDPAVKAAINPFAYLVGKMAGVQISNAYSNNPSVSWRGKPTEIYIDEMPASAEMASYILPQDIAYIKILRPPFLFGFEGGPGGAIVIYLRRGDDILPDQMGKSFSIKSVIGYTSAKEFYSPDYSDDSAFINTKDIRPTLYWIPFLLTTPQEHEKKITFYNNDISHRLRVIIEGIDGNGRFLHIEKLVE